MYVLFDKDTSSIISPQYDRPYTVDGKPAVLPDNVVELQYVYLGKPQLSLGQSLIREEVVDTATKTITVNWKIINPTQEELDKLQKEDSEKLAWKTWIDKSNEGYTDQVTNIKLKTTEEAKSVFTSMIVLLNEAISQGFLNSKTIVSIWDYNDEEKQMTVSDAKTLLTRYGLFCKVLHDVYKP